MCLYRVTLRTCFIALSYIQGGTPRKFGWGCAARFWKPLSYFRPKYVIFPTLFQTWPKIWYPGKSIYKHQMINLISRKKEKLQRRGWIGICKSADPCYFLARSVDPTLFSFKSGSVFYLKTFHGLNVVHIGIYICFLFLLQYLDFTRSFLSLLVFEKVAL